MKNWYTLISQDISNVADALDYYETELVLARHDLKIQGVIERISAEMPGIVEHRFTQLQEIEAILELLNIEHRKARSAAFKRFLEHYERSLSARDVEKYVDGEDSVVSMEKLINEFALMRNRWLGITKGLDAKQFQLNNIIKLRVSGLDDFRL